MASWNHSAPETYVEIEAYGKKVVALVDTGCDHSMIGSRMVQGFTLKPTNLQAFAANKEPLKILGKMNYRFELRGISLELELMVSSNITR